MKTTKRKGGTPPRHRRPGALTPAQIASVTNATPAERRVAEIHACYSKTSAPEVVDIPRLVWEFVEQLRATDGVREVYEYSTVRYALEDFAKKHGLSNRAMTKVSERVADEITVSKPEAA